MDLCIFTWFGFRYPFAEIIKLIKDAGFQSVMTWWGDEYKDSSGPKEKEAEIAEKAGLKIENTHFTFAGINSIWEDSLDGEAVLARYCSYIEDCKTYGIPTAVMHASNGENPPPPNKLGLDRFRRLIDKAEKSRVNIAVENVRKPEYIDFLLKNINSEKLKFCYDSGHEHCFSPERNFLADYGSRLAALHLHDNDGTGDQHLLPFDGTVNWKKIIAGIKGINTAGQSANLRFDAPAAYGGLPQQSANQRFGGV